MNHRFGPWTTAIHTGSAPRLSTFWKTRMRFLPGLRRCLPMPARRQLFVLAVVAAATLALPTMRGPLLAPVLADNKPRAAPQQEDEKKALEEFHKLYALPEGEVLKRVAPPFVP